MSNWIIVLILINLYCFVVVEMAERFAYYGIAGNMMMYLTKVMEEPVATAAKNVNSWNGVSSLALFIGAFFADSFLGRFNTTLISSSVFLMVCFSFPFSLFFLYLLIIIKFHMYYHYSPTVVFVWTLNLFTPHFFLIPFLNESLLKLYIQFPTQIYDRIWFFLIILLEK